MKLADLHERLIAAARTTQPSDHVPYAFEKRIVALIEAIPAPDRWLLWSRALWRAALGCLALVLLFGTCVILAPHNAGAPGDLSQDFENTMLASADQDAESTW